MLFREQFYGCEEKNIKGACQQVIDGDNAFKVLYDVLAGENGMERVLKPMFRGRQPASAFIAGVDITVEMLSLYSSGKAYIRNPELFNLNHLFITILLTELIATV